MLRILLLACVATGAWAKDHHVCSSSKCLEGRTESLIAALSNDIALLPGHYTPSSPLATLESLDSVHGSLKITPETYLSSTYNASTSLAIIPPDIGLMYSGYLYAGQRQPMGQTWQSLYVPSGSYANLGEGKVLWNAVPDSNQLPTSSRARKVIAFGSTGCEPVCSSHGTCIPSTSTNSSGGTCQCSTGWTGPQCTMCSKGYFGPSCKPCVGDCTVCDDGLSGTGICLGTRSSSVKACRCAHGTCNAANDDCTCAAGWKTGGNDLLRCGRCIDGYAINAQGECKVCPLGCTTCGISSDSRNLTVCSDCTDGWTLSSNGLCVNARTACTDGQFYNNATGSCSSCSPACATCTGPGANDCLTCNSPRINFMGSCVGFSTSDGVCETILNGVAGAFVADNERGACNSCPVGCLSCAIPDFGAGSKLSDAKCTACQQGYLLEDGTCVQQCSKGRFAPSDAVNNGTCQTCDTSVCRECAGSPATCTRCSASDLFAAEGKCGQTCPTGYFPSNSSCAACDPDCASCTGSGTCATCPLARPVLLNGQCIPSCPSNQYYDSTSSTCIGCDAGCLTCTGAGSQQCTSCPDGSVLRGGACAAALCEAATFASGFGECLSAFLVKPSKRWWPFLLLALGLVAAIGGGAWWYIRTQRRKQRARVQEFGDALDDVTVSRRLQVLRLERVLGLQRAPAPTTQPETPKGLRTLRLPLFAQWRRNDDSIGKRKSEIDTPPPYDTTGAAHSRTALVNSKSQSFMLDEISRPASAMVSAATIRDMKEKPNNNPFRAL